MNTTSPCKQKKTKNKGVCHTVALPFTFFKKILRQKKNYENSNIFPDAKKIIFKNSSERNQTKILEDIITL
jgi:hypothetical protein